MLCLVDALGRLQFSEGRWRVDLGEKGNGEERPWWGELRLGCNTRELKKKSNI